MASKYSVLLRTIVKENGLEPLHTSSDYDTRLLTVADVNRPALQLAGFYNYFDPNRLQIIGRVESTYLELKTEAARRRSLCAMTYRRLLSATARRCSQSASRLRRNTTAICS